MSTLATNTQPASQLIVHSSDFYWQRLLEAWPQVDVELTSEQVEQIKLLLGLSDFVADQLCRHPDWLQALLGGELEKLDRQSFDTELHQLLENVTNEDEAKKVLRGYRNRQMVRLACRDFLALSVLEEALLDLSALAEALIITARDWLYSDMCQQYGTPCNANGDPQPLLILGMGKLGGRELNFSSDIDLIFTFPEKGETQGARRSIDNQKFFTRMGQHLINMLHQVTVDGFVYRVDMRLRPYGDSGPLVVSFSALEDYYQENGREWERYAMVKARSLGPWSRFSDELHSLLRPFVYRRYIDFSAIDSLRHMKQLISQEVRRRKLIDNIKLGAGGIREVEFVVQSFQLIRGGREPALRQQSLFAAIDTLYRLGQLEYRVVDELKHSYVLLRRVENLLQALNDAQTQTLPDNDLDWQRLCYVLQEADENAVRQQIEAAMQTIHSHFLATIGGGEQEDVNEAWTQQLWRAEQTDDALGLLAEHGIDDFDFWPQVQAWRETVQRRSIGPRGRETLDKLMPKLLCEFTQQTSPSDTFKSVSKVIDQIVTRTTYLELLYENPGARQQLVSLCCASPWIAKQLASFPMLLDELIDPAHLYDTTSLDDYGSELRQYLLRIPEEDMEQQMEGLRQFKLSQQLKIAAADVTGVLPVMQVSDHLTFLAEAIIEQVVHQAWQQVAERHGMPAHLVEGEMGFAVIAYGKAGGLELGYGSDLDLVFLHNSPQGTQTNGPKVIDAGRFYQKMAQRILHLFSTRTISGELYELDMRLRPSGSSGLLVSVIDEFANYQKQEAWTWEHQALVRARLIFGGNRLAERFSEIRSQVLTQDRDRLELASQVHQMRLKMRQHLLKVESDKFDLKQSQGGIADIEFIAQYLVLANANAHPSLSIWSDNVRIFTALAELDILSLRDAQHLTQTYCYLRDESHRLTLQQKPAVIELDKVSMQIEEIKTIYQRIFAVNNEGSN